MDTNTEPFMMKFWLFIKSATKALKLSFQYKKITALPYCFKQIYSEKHNDMVLSQTKKLANSQTWAQWQTTITLQIQIETRTLLIIRIEKIKALKYSGL